MILYFCAAIVLWPVFVIAALRIFEHDMDLDVADYVFASAIGACLAFLWPLTIAAATMGLIIWRHDHR